MVLSLLYLKDELAGVFKSANQYRGGKGSDEEDLLSQYDGASEVSLRKSGLIDLASVPLSIFGSSQDKVMEKLMGDEDDENGKWSRFLFVRQPPDFSFLTSVGRKQERPYTAHPTLTEDFLMFKKKQQVVC